MQYLGINRNTTLAELSNRVGSAIDQFLHVNNMDRVPNVGEAYINACNAISDSDVDVSASRKLSILSTMTSDSDIFQSAALTDVRGWRLLSSKNVLPNTLKVPDNINLPSSFDVLGDNVPVTQQTFERVATSLKSTGAVDPSIFNSVSAYSATPSREVVGNGGRSGSDPMQWFHIPWGEVTLYSSIDETQVDFPVYPEEMSDSRKADYTTMPDTLYQYEPWQIYTSSGPRSNTYTFHFHRDMWTGDHRDGKANELIRICMANLYPRYRGSAVDTAIVTLFIHGSVLIRGILTDVTVDWSGPIGLDGMYLECKLTLSITEVSSEALNFATMKNKPLIG